jgi:site-specific recombinase XerD
MQRGHIFPELVQRFFTEHLATQRNLSPHTIAAYRDSFRLLLRFLSAHLHVGIDRLTLESLTPQAVLAFLDDLERTRGNTARTRNYRLAAIRAFIRFVLSLGEPGVFVDGHRVLAIPVKRSARPMLGFMTREEVIAVLAAPNLASWSGRRDHLLFTLLYNTGARVSEALQLRFADVQDRIVRLHGKGRKDRAVPIWVQTATAIKRWCRENHLRGDQLLFTNLRGGLLTRQGARFRLRLALRTAAATCPTLTGRKIGPHTFRHSCAMHLLQSGVALEVIALWLGHERSLTTHGYVEADLNMKEDSLRRLEELPAACRPRRAPESRLLSFLEAKDYVNFRPRPPESTFPPNHGMSR